MMNNNAIVQGSLQAMATRTGASLAETFCQCDIVVLVDTSASMECNDSRGGKSRYAVACDELANLQATMPGKIGVISFSNSVQFCPGGVPVNLRNSTDLAAALRFAKIADAGGIRFVVISDGEPDDKEAALAEARRYTGRIDTVFVGPENDPYGGRAFLQRLANAQGGKFTVASCAVQLAESVTLLLEAANV